MVRKSIVWSFLAILLSGCAQSQERFEVAGKVTGIDKGTAFLVHAETRDTLDKVKIKGGTFSFSGKWPDTNVWIIPTMVLCTQHDRQQSRSVSLALETNPLELDMSMDQLPVFRGTRFQDMMTMLAKEMDMLTRQLHDSITGQVVVPIRQRISRVFEVFYYEFEPDYHKGFVSLMVVDALSNGTAHPDDFYRLPGMCYEIGIKDKYDTLICEALANFRDSWIGVDPLQIKGTTDKGEAFSLESLLGEKNVLLDFWASWCAPCIYDMPKLKEYDAKYDIEIIGISIDQKPDDWKKALEKLNLPWTNILDVNGEIKKAYQIKSVPTKIVINKNGVIVGRNPEDLEGLIKALQ